MAVCEAKASFTKPQAFLRLTKQAGKIILTSLLFILIQVNLLWLPEGLSGAQRLHQQQYEPGRFHSGQIPW
jgi:hypothetical protein